MGRGVAVLNSVGLYCRYGDSVCNIAPDIPPPLYAYAYVFFSYFQYGASIYLSVFFVSCA